MTPFRLTTWFRKRMLALVVAAMAPIVIAPPVAFFVLKRSELLADARGQAAQVAEVVRTAVEERPRLWRYDAIKLGERLAAEGLDRAPLRVLAAGVEVPIEHVRPGAGPRSPLWGRFDLSVPDPHLGHHMVAASVWVAVEGSSLVSGTLGLGALFGLLSLVLGTLLYLLPVRAVASGERRVHRLLGELALTLQEQDRRRIARDLHDAAGQAITAARLELLALAQPHAGGPDGAELSSTLARVAAHLDEALAEVRRSTEALAPPALAELGFVRALERHCETFADAVGLRVSCRVGPDVPPLRAEAELSCYRIVQEALANTARHAGAVTAEVAIGVAGSALVVSITDDGNGLVGAGDEGRRGRGLRHIEERAALLGGRVELADPGPAGRGLRVAVFFPLQEVRV